MMYYLVKIKAYWIYVVMLFGFFGNSQSSTYVDDKGVYRWSHNDAEIRLFGVNYTLPFAHGFRAINYIGKDHKEAIDKDVYHMARLGFDAFRIHVWDAEISDADGSIIQTTQLDLLDYTLFKMKERGIKTIVTPFKVGGNGYPEKDQDALGFSATLSKPDTYYGENVLKKQERYFKQLLNHVNPYTGLAYKNDPDIIALEINNEPQHDDGAIATKYINRLVGAIRNTGFQNPIFYNVSERSQFIEDYCKANIQGCTFQWYPTGLVYNKTLKGNYLPHVDKYSIPFEDNADFKNKTRIIYEFDPADNATSYLYPAMARSFREAKFQFAAQFAYEPLDLAYANTEYQTHYLNLAFTPSKALSLAIASEVFHEMDSGQSFGRYPHNLSFGNTVLDPEKDLAIYSSDTKFYHTNITETIPKNPTNLEKIAGVGSSPIVRYGGTGAYFLDKIQNGVWRLEVMPDVLWVNDPFEKTSLKKTVAVIEWHLQNMDIKLPDLGDTFSVRPLNKENTFHTASFDGSFQIRPGTYLITKKGTNYSVPNDRMLSNISLDEFVGPPNNVDKTYVVHQPIKSIEIGQDLLIEAKVVAPYTIEQVAVVLPSGYHKVDTYPMEKTDAFSYKANIPKSRINRETFSYYIVVTTAQGNISFPSGIEGSPEDWDFVSKAQYTTQIVSKEPVVVLFDALDGFENMIWPSQWNAVKYNASIRSSKFDSDKKLEVSITDLNAIIPDMTFKIYVSDKIKRWENLVTGTNKIVFKGSSGNSKKQNVQIALQLKNGAVFGKIIELDTTIEERVITYEELVRVPQVLLPRPFPVFQTYYFNMDSKEIFNASEIETIQISIGPGIPNDQLLQSQHLEIENIYLSK